MLDFLQQNWFNFIQTIFLLLGFYLAYITYKDDKHSQQLNHLLSLNRNHQKIWNEVAQNTKLLKSLNRKPTKKKPITTDEYYFVRQLVFHLYTTYSAIQLGQMEFNKGIENDIRDYFSRPIPRQIWKELRDYQDDEFVVFIESVLK